MAHKIAKLLLERADSFADRKKAIKAAMDLGMPLHEIEEYLEWLDLANGDHRAGQDSGTREQSTE
jgi:DNA-binding transcriptional MerR regulator